MGPTESFCFDVAELIETRPPGFPCLGAADSTKEGEVLLAQAGSAVDIATKAIAKEKRVV
ncbi:hypothetical protein DZC30_21015 [Comamonas testosteroni]|uniref:Uncharacterized protein n=1 Tax=Comamonas testosteroni TaxID=285 RepID=A0A373F840_COMTE|nr:hypothetical protein DZC30_21015 [Comamonas testosteroni]